MNSEKMENIKLLKSNKGKDKLCVDGFMFNNERTTKKKKMEN